MQDKKNSLAPIIQELRTLRLSFTQAESEFKEKKREYDSIMIGMDRYMLCLLVAMK